MIDAYTKLDKRVQKWIFKQGWTNLREIQFKAIQPILSGTSDVIISASTAAGKTEAFFLPACSAVVGQKQGINILYVSPLKALINDQYRRLEELCDMLDMKVTPWHGDSLQSKKKKTKSKPSGILLITPESLESLLVREPVWVKKTFALLQYICIDEFHAFIGNERGQQLLSLLGRLEHLLNRIPKPIPRIALSATLGELEKLPPSLRPNKSIACEIITDSKEKFTLKVKVKGFVEPTNTAQNETLNSAEYQICREIYQRCRGSSHLVFANSRARTESITARLADFSKQDIVPNEFFPHHGSLSKALREELEARLQKETVPTTAICTMTLELGIDIGKVNSVIQVTAPHSVSSLRQRLGRSGRQNSPAILRMLISENDLSDKSNIIDNLRLQLVQSLAMFRLLIAKWFEPPDIKQMHLSTFLHQILSVIAQWGSVREDQLYLLLCTQGPFKKISKSYYKEFLSGMRKKQLLQQLHSGELVLGEEGERLVNSYKFYTVFKTPEEYRVIAENKTLGTLPLDSIVLENQRIVFGGKRWKVTDVVDSKKTIYVVPAKGGSPPKFGGGTMSIHDTVRQEMFSVYCAEDYRIEAENKKIEFADEMARQLFKEGVEFFNRFDLANKPIVQSGKNCYLFPWLGDKAVNTLTVMLIQHGFVASSFSGVIEITNTTVEKVANYLINTANGMLSDETNLAKTLPEGRKYLEKYDRYISEPLLSEGYGRKAFDLTAVKHWILENLFR